MTNFERILEFFEKYEKTVPEKAQWPDDKGLGLSLSLIKEELREVIEEIEKRESLEDTAKELCDLLYVCYAACATFGIDADACFKEVHNSNMSKLGEDGKPIYREDGKVLKGPNYRLANLKGLLDIKNK